MPRQLGSSTLLVLQALVRGYRYGFDIMDATGLPSGTVYPILSRLEELGLARSAWEDQRIAVKEKRPRANTIGSRRPAPPPPRRRSGG